MARVILPDSGPLGFITNPNANKESAECNLWMQARLKAGVRVLVPEIFDYEVRRELMLIGSPGIAKLDVLKTAIGYTPITTDVMLHAASFWSQARRMGKPTASDKAL